MNDRDIWLMVYVDGELDAEAAREVEQVLESDPEARAKVEVYRETRSLLRAACAESFYATGRDHVLPLRSQRARPQRRRLAATVAAACVAAGLLGFAGGRLAVPGGSARDDLLDEIAEYHEVFSQETDHLVEVPANRSAELQSWLSARLGRELKAPDLSRAGLRFAGGRMLVIDDKPVAELMYTRASGPPLALCVTAMGGGTEPLHVDTRGDLHLASWTDGRFAFVVVGELDGGAARGIANLAAAQLQG